MAERCYRCKREIRWATTTSGKRIMLDNEASDAGEFRLTYEAARMKGDEVVPAVTWAAFVPADYRAAARREVGLYAAHRDTCDPITPEDVATADTERGATHGTNPAGRDFARESASIAG